MKKILILFTILFMLVGCHSDGIKYDNKTYILLEYNMDVFTYLFDNPNHESFEVESIKPIMHPKWDLIYNCEDIYVVKHQSRKAISYYGNDENYEWYFTYEMNDELYQNELDLTKEELDYLYKIEDVEEYHLITFEEIDVFGDVEKVSQDRFVRGVLNLVLHEGDWYYKTEIMNDDNQEYIIPLLPSLNKKINSIVNQQTDKTLLLGE